MPAGAGGPVTGTLPRPADPAASPSRGRAGRCPGAPCSPPPAASSSSSPSRATACPPSPCSARPRSRSPSAGSGVRSGLWLGLVFGLAFFVPLLSWTGIYVGPLPWLALAGWEALHLALLGGATALTSRLPLWPLWTAALWVADEALRGRFVLGGFPWGRLGFSQTEGPLLSLAAYGGVPLVSFAVALTGALLAAAALALHRAWRSRRRRGSAVRRCARPPCAWSPSWPSRSSARWPGCRCPGPR